MIADSVKRTASDGLEKALVTVVAQGRFTHPAHGQSIVAMLHGCTKKLAETNQPDALLYAYAIRDLLPLMQGYMDHLKKWSDVVTQCGPDDVPPTGANACL